MKHLEQCCFSLFSLFVSTNIVTVSVCKCFAISHRLYYINRNYLHCILQLKYIKKRENVQYCSLIQMITIYV